MIYSKKIGNLELYEQGASICSQASQLEYSQ